jgi:hypothetical protein
MRQNPSFCSGSGAPRAGLAIGLLAGAIFFLAGQTVAAETLDTQAPAGQGGAPVANLASSPADTAVPPIAAPAPAAETAQPVVKKLSVFEAISQAKDLLREKLAMIQASRKKAPTYASMPAVADMTLAVWDRASDKIDLYEAAKQGLKLSIKTPGAPNIRVKLSSKLYSRYEVFGDSNKLVVGVIYPVASLTWINKTKVYTTKDVVHVPYSNAFYTPDVLAGGSNYLSYRIKDAFDELAHKQVLSRAFPAKPVIEVIDPYLIKSIAIIEHTNYQSLARPDDPESAIGYFLVNLALNQEEAFDESVSSAGARGLVQFIPSTYALTVRNRPDMGLIKDFQAGMADHKNAIMAEVAYLDQALAEMPDGLKKLYSSDSARAAEFLAAAYNGGTSRVKTAYNVWGDDWVGSHVAEIGQLDVRNEALIDEIEAMKAKLKKTTDRKLITQLENKIWSQRVVRKGVLNRLAELNKGSLKKETVQYVAKLKKVYGMLTAGYFATPDAPANTLPEAKTVVVALPTSGSAPSIEALPLPPAPSLKQTPLVLAEPVQVGQ